MEAFCITCKNTVNIVLVNSSVDVDTYNCPHCGRLFHYVKLDYKI
jgi:DNA-directed RNA polymerase subunit RPC12/RpoP